MSLTSVTAYPHGVSIASPKNLYFKTHLPTKFVSTELSAAISILVQESILNKGIKRKIISALYILFCFLVRPILYFKGCNWQKNPATHGNHLISAKKVSNHLVSN
jgi:hypothetical protein